MKPFDLERALAGDICIDPDGNEVRVLGVLDDAGNAYPVVLALRAPGGGEVLLFATKDGLFDRFNPDAVLKMKPKYQEFWANILMYNGKPYSMCASLHPSEAEEFSYRTVLVSKIEL